MIERKPPRIQDKPFQLFTYGQYRKPGLSRLSELQRKIYNMLKANFSTHAIGKRLNMTNGAVCYQVCEIRAKDIEI